MPTAGPRRTKTQREADLAETARLDRLGYSQREIAAKIGVSCVQICYDLRTIRKRYARQAMEHTRELVGETLALLRDVRKEAHEAWERSKTIKGRPPQNDFLQTILATAKATRELLGLDKLDFGQLITAAQMVQFADALMAAASAEIQDEDSLTRIKARVLEMLPSMHDEASEPTPVEGEYEAEVPVEADAASPLASDESARQVPLSNQDPPAFAPCCPPIAANSPPLLEEV